MAVARPEVGVGDERESPFEPLTITPRYPAPRAHVSSDRSAGWIRRLLPLMRPHIRLMALGMVTAVTAMVVRVVIPRVTQAAIDNSLIGHHGHHAPLTGYVITLVTMAAAILVLGFTFRYTMQKAAFELEYAIRVLLFQQFTRLSFSFYDRTQTGELVSRANSDVRSLQMFLAFGPMMGLTLVSFVAALVLMLKIHVMLTIVTLAVLPLVYTTASRMTKWIFPLSWLIAARQAEVATIVEENVAGTQVVKSFAAEGGQISMVDRAAERLQWASIKLADVRAKFGPVIQNLPRLGLAVVLYYGGYLVIHKQITIGALFAFNAYVMLIQLPFMILGFVIMMAQRAAASAQRIMEILDEGPAIVDSPGAVDLVECRGDVELRDVTFRYSSAGAPVLDHLNLHLRPGETVALVGRTGSGKSSVARVIPRFYDVTDGAVIIDGKDVRDVTVVSLRSHVGLVLDDSYLFSGTVRENIAFGRPDATDEDIEAAAVAAGAEDFIHDLPQGYETVVGERGSTLSGGQRQRVAIARTLLVNPRILILDDCTSSIDAHREHEIHGALRTLMAGRTTLIIAHRLSTISLAERVVVLDRGRIVADGAHEELLRTSPLYGEILAQGLALDDEREATSWE